MRRASWTALAAVAACLLIASPSALAADGDVDAEFHFDGIQQLPGGHVAHLALQADGKVIAAGEAPGGDTNAVVFRLTPTGSVDPTFGDDGHVTLTATGGLGIAGTAVQPDGRILVAGTANQLEDSDVIVFRLNSDGSLDGSFDGDGSVRFDFATEFSRAGGLVLQPDGRIVVAGDRGGADFAAARLNPDGGLDATFSGDGRVVEDLGGDREEVRGVTLQGDRAVVVGWSNAARTTDPATSQFAALRLSADGSRDNSFGPGGNGAALGDLGAPSEATDVVATPDGGLLLAGSASRPGAGRHMAALKLDGAGRPDTSFSGDGAQFIDLAGDLDEAGTAATTTVDGKFAIAGYTSGNPFDPRLQVAKLTPTGALDPSFGDAGRRIYGTLGHFLTADIERQPNGKLLVGGHDGGGMAVARIDDSVPFVGVTGGSADEGQIVPFQIALSKTSGFPVTVSYVTGEGTAAEGLDFLTRSGSVVIPAGTSGVTLGIGSIRDRLLEGTESFRVVLSAPAGAVLGEENARGTIRNVLRSGRCANLLIGLGRTDLLTGSRASDEIFGRTGDDFIAGLGAGDCLYGERGADEIDGGEGSDYVSGGAQDDTLRGGNGNDRLYGGRGRNRYSGGPGNDVILARNGKTEKIDCGPGRDSAKVDRTDRVRSCERVTRG